MEECDLKQSVLQSDKTEVLQCTVVLLQHHDAGGDRRAVFIGVAKGVDGIVAVIAELHIAHAVHQLEQPLVALVYRAAQFVAVDVDVVKKPAEICLAVAALGGVLDRLKDSFQRLVQILVQRRAAADTAKQLARQDEKAFGADQIVSGLLRIAV